MLPRLTLLRRKRRVTRRQQTPRRRSRRKRKRPRLKAKTLRQKPMAPLTLRQPREHLHLLQLLQLPRPPLLLPLSDVSVMRQDKTKRLMKC